MAKRSTTHTAIPKLSEMVVDGKPTDLCWDYLATLSKIVIAKCFTKYLDHFEVNDLAQLATCDAVAFSIKVSQLQTDEDIKNIRNVMFTRIRNTLSNFIFRSNKLVDTEDEILDQTVVYPKSMDIKSDLVNLYDLDIHSIDSCRTVSVRTWKLFQTNGARQHYAITSSNDNIEDWETYSEIRNMKYPCDLINIYDSYTDDQVETLATKLDEITGQNYFNTLYQLLGDKFLPFLDVFQEDKFDIPSTMFVKHVLTDMSICNDFNNGTTIDDLSTKYGKPANVIKKIVDSREVI